MDIIGILTGIGVNETFLYQFGIFSFTFYFLIFIVLRPYQQALIARRDNTQGSEELADQILDETKKLQDDYASVAKKINDQVKSIYDSARKTANQSASDLVAGARKSADGLTNTNTTALNKQIESARSEFKSEIPGLSGKIVLKLLGKES